MKKTDRQIKTEATKKEKYRVFENFDPPRDIFAECSDGTWVRKVWKSGNNFGWSSWGKTNY